MSDITSLEKMHFEKLFGMSSGYVMNFTNRSFQDFFKEISGIEIFHPKYNYSSGSKANRLRAFWSLEGNIIVGNLLLNMLDYWKSLKDVNNQIIIFSEEKLFNDCQIIAKRLVKNEISKAKSKIDLETEKKKEQEYNQEYQLDLLLEKFDNLSKLADHQERGFLLQELLNNLFLVLKIPVSRSYTRNEGGEQIDGAFSYQGWYYLVECKWTKKLADIRELDSLSGKVNRSGRQSMGLFLSIEGWSENVLPLLKQNPDKTIILMDGYDLRCILCKAIEFEFMLQEKLAKLNLESKPFYSCSEILVKR